MAFAQQMTDEGAAGNRSSASVPAGADPASARSGSVRPAVIGRLLFPEARAGTGRFPGNPPPILFCLDKRECAAAGGRENRRVPNLAHFVQGLADTGVVRIGLPLTGGPADPAPEAVPRRTAPPHPMVRGRDVGAKGNWRILTPARSALLRAALASAGVSNNRSCYALPGRLLVTFWFEEEWMEAPPVAPVGAAPKSLPPWGKVAGRRTDG